MSEEKNSINQILANPELLTDDNCFGFYDWFCSDTALKNRALKMLPQLRFLVKEGILDGDKHYVWFKNNCPMWGNLYDDFRISEIGGDEKYVGGFCTRTGHPNEEMKASFWMLGDKFEDGMKLIEMSDWAELKFELKNGPIVRPQAIKHFNK